LNNETRFLALEILFPYAVVRGINISFNLERIFNTKYLLIQEKSESICPGKWKK
jgi:hypothetical protein